MSSRWSSRRAHVLSGPARGGGADAVAAWRGGIGTDYAKLNPRLKEFDDPITGERLLAIPAIDIDVAIIHAGAADPYGNVQHVGTGFGDRSHHRAADKTIVTVDKVIPNEEVRANPYRTSIAGVDAVVRAPYGSHPMRAPATTSRTPSTSANMSAPRPPG